MPLLAVLTVLISYLFGSIPAAAWLARTRGVDIRKVGSGNSGATNVQRSLGNGPALLVAAFDILKGALAVWLAAQLNLGLPVMAACGVAAVVGHNFSPFLGFRGGKGVATTFGTVVALLPLAGAGFVLVFIATVWLTRLVSAGSILASVVAAFTAFLLGPVWLALVVCALAGLLTWQHRENVRKLHAGTERRFGQKV
ncbi:glycerol-3-phosphate 1-O-acyltransferase PlsY [Deinococcus taeanensis]|uniref:glycerol-3-phosphate 1-O-acyltransferase PlsY n=1 Tax=Deinococcus taeanensis TaxID=2737050 RepID=UPI001CDD68C4|nr:glycerol-3-phosphate 1-O-acyltransferase PlsY [Deinococcus taeanensis]UBV43242.1 glycerol-3-phosphate 1-O-acyltransferase PlsY [Deinococcus taeanensis]